MLVATTKCFKFALPALSHRRAARALSPARTPRGGEVGRARERWSAPWPHSLSSTMRAPFITIAHGVCLLYDTGSHTKPFSRLRSDMPLLIYPAATMLHDRCEANDFSEYEKDTTAYCATSRPRSKSRSRFSRSASPRATAASREPDKNGDYFRPKFADLFSLRRCSKG